MLNVTKRDFPVKTQGVTLYKNTVEAGLNLSADNLEKIISAGGFVAEPSCTIEGGFLRLLGKVYFNVVFVGEDIERLEAGVKFDYKRALSDTSIGVQGGADNTQVEARARYYLSDVAVKEDGGMLYVTAELNEEVTFIYTTPQRLVSGGNLLVKSVDIDREEVYCARATYNGEENFERAKIKKVVASSVDACVTGVRARADQLIVEGRAYVSLVMQPSQGGDIFKERFTAPFSFEMECVGAKEGDLAFAECAVKGQTVKVLNLEESNNSQISVCYSLDIFGSSVRTVTQACVCDAYSPHFEVEKQYTSITATKFLGQKTLTERAFGRAICQVPEYSRLITTLNEAVILTQADFSGSELTIGGIASADCVFQGDNGIESRRAELPFEIKVDKSGDRIDNICVVAESFSAKLKSGRIELDISLRVCFNESAIYTAQVVEEIIEGEQKSVNKSIISVYMAKKGDTEWDVMCATGEDIQVIAKHNPELCYPLSGTEKIMIYRCDL